MMRLVPVVLFYFPDAPPIPTFAAASSRTTHAAQEAAECCLVISMVIASALRGDTKEQVLQVESTGLIEPKVIAIAQGVYRKKACADIAGSRLYSGFAGSRAVVLPPD